MPIERDSDTRDSTGPMWRPAIVGVFWLAVMASVVGQWVLFLQADAQRALGTAVAPGDIAAPLFSVVLATFGAVVVMRGDSAVYGWLMLLTGFAMGLIGFAGPYAVVALEEDLPLASLSAWVQDLWFVTWMLALLLLPALFPDGRVSAGRWRVPVIVATAVWVLLIVTFVFTERPVSNWFLLSDDPPANATGFLPVPDTVYNLTWVVVSFSSFAIGLGSLVTRWRRADFDMRQRIKWVLFAFGLLLTYATLNLINQIFDVGGVELGLYWVMNVLGAAALVGLAVALGLAVLRFRLYDVDLFISRTIVYGLLTILVVATYVAVVVGVGAILPFDQTLLALVVTGVVAVAFGPLRARLQGWVNRLMFGQRDEPYAVLSEMGRLMIETGSPKDTLQKLTEVVATSLKLPGAAIELEQDGEWTVRASFGDQVSEDSVGVILPLHDQGELVGRLLVLPRSPRTPLTSQDLALLEDIAHSAGAIARSVRLTVALQASRERLVLAQEEERRRVRRDLHDGLGPSLASQTLQLDEVLDRLHDDPRGAAQLLGALKEQNQQLVADIRRLVFELRPPALDELGVVGALAAYAAQFDRPGALTIEVGTDPDPLPSMSAALEVAAYRVAREAITNTVRHARATRCTTTLEATDEKLTISIRDDGVGIGPTVQTGVGLISMRERSEELGGTFEAVSLDAGGTEIIATLPLMKAWQPEEATATDASQAGSRRG